MSVPFQISFPESALLRRSIDDHLNLFFFFFLTWFHTHAQANTNTHTATHPDMHVYLLPAPALWDSCRVQKGGAAVAATSIVGVDLCTREERNDLVQMLPDCRGLDSCTANIFATVSVSQHTALITLVAPGALGVRTHTPPHWCIHSHLTETHTHTQLDTI